MKINLEGKVNSQFAGEGNVVCFNGAMIDVIDVLIVSLSLFLFPFPFISPSLNLDIWDAYILSLI